ncbi:MAG: beta-lactamase family protein [Pseudomonadales bacterium]|nr:beta-lactamase family protein [Pseudomonadales bacterium]
MAESLAPNFDLKALFSGSNVNINPLARFENNIKVPSSLAEVTTIADNEVNPTWLGVKEADKQAVWKAVENLYKTGMYPAVSICVRRHGEIVLNRSIGHAKGNGPQDTDAKQLVTPDTPFCLFSASKAITAMLVHLLEEQGEINLLNPVSYYIPEFGQNGKENITVHQILAHRAGISRIPAGEYDPEILFDYDEVVRILFEAEPESIHGREMAYHAVTGGYVIGELFKAITGDSIREYMRTQVQEPLGFKYFNYGASAEDYPAIARNYISGLPLIFPLNFALERILGVPLDKALELSNDPRFYDQVIPAGNIVATAEECSRFFQCLLNGGELEGKRIFQPVTIERAVREVNKTTIDKTLLLPMRYSAGMMLGDKGWGTFGPATPHAYGHLGLTNNFCWADPQRAISVSLLTSGNPVIGSHLPRLGMLLGTISKRFHKVFS